MDRVRPPEQRPESFGVTRAQKVSKEEVAGLMAALEEFVSIDENQETTNYSRQMNFVVDQSAEVPGISTEVRHDYDHYIPHAVIEFNNDWRGPGYIEVCDLLKVEHPRIYAAADHRDPPSLMWIDPLNLQDGEVEIVADKLRRVLIELASGD